MKRSAAKGFEDEYDAEIVSKPTEDDDKNVVVKFPDGKVYEDQDDAIAHVNGTAPNGWTIK